MPLPFRFSVGLLLGPLFAQPSAAADIVETITTPQATLYQRTAIGTDRIAITSMGAGTLDGLELKSDAGAIAVTLDASFASVKATSVSGDVTIGGATQTPASRIYTESHDGAIRVTGSGKILSQAPNEWGVFAASGSRNVTIDRSGGITMTGAGSLAISAYTSPGLGGGIAISNLGAISALGSGSAGVSAASGQGGISIGGASGLARKIEADNFALLTTGTTGDTNIVTAAGGKVTSVNGDAISMQSSSGTLRVMAGDDVSGATTGIAATAMGPGRVEILSAPHVTIGAHSTGSGIAYGIYASSGGGDVVIGDGQAGLGFVSGEMGIYASTNGAGAIGVTIGGGVTSTFGPGVETVADGATTIKILSGAHLTSPAGSPLIKAMTTDGSVVIHNASTIRGSILGVLGATFSGAGTGSFELNNTGTVTLAADQSLEVYSTFDHSMRGFGLVNQSGGLLTGTGQFGDVTSLAGSTIRPGDRSVDLLAATPAQRQMRATSLSLAAGATLEVRADYAGVSDNIAVSGPVTVSGATLRLLTTPKTESVWVDKRDYPVITGTAISGDFARVETDYAFLKASSWRSADNLTLFARLERNWQSFTTYAGTRNQKAVADTLDAFQLHTSSPVIQRVLLLTTAQAPAALTQMSGAGLALTRRHLTAANSAFLDTVGAESDPAPHCGERDRARREEKCGDRALAAKKSGPPALFADARIWAHVFGGMGNLRALGADAAERGSHSGLAAGADVALSEHLRVGAAFAFGQSAMRASALGVKADSTWAQSALYGVATDGELYAKAILAFAYFDTRGERSVTAFGELDKATGRFGAALVSARLEAGRRFDVGGFGVTPFAAVEPSILLQNGYRESGPASITLGFDKSTGRALPTTLGTKFDATSQWEDWRLNAALSLGWVRRSGAAPTIAPAFTALPGSTFTVEGARDDRHLARMDLHLEATRDGSMGAFTLDARTDLGRRTTALRASAGALLRF